MTTLQPYIGCAGWSVPADARSLFDAEGSHLQRYASRFNTVEINSSFYRPHRPATYARWAGTVPAGFRFTAKFPREITHARRLVDSVEPLERFLAEVDALGEKLGCLLLQLPPSLAYESTKAGAFFDSLRQRYGGAVAVEPRHATWFAEPAELLLQRFSCARVAADPALSPGAAEPGGDRAISYFRLHGSPRIYYSKYPDDYLAALAVRIAAASALSQHVWCIFDNTAAGAATHDALTLMTI